MFYAKVLNKKLLQGTQIIVGMIVLLVVLWLTRVVKVVRLSLYLYIGLGRKQEAIKTCCI